MTVVTGSAHMPSMTVSNHPLLAVMANKLPSAGFRDIRSLTTAFNDTLAARAGLSSRIAKVQMAKLTDLLAEGETGLGDAYNNTAREISALISRIGTRSIATMTPAAARHAEETVKEMETALTRMANAAWIGDRIGRGFTGADMDAVVGAWLTAFPEDTSTLAPAAAA